MVMEHTTLPLFGIQYHPESICTEKGNMVITNFLKHAAEHHLNKKEGREQQEQKEQKEQQEQQV